MVPPICLSSFDNRSLCHYHPATRRSPLHSLSTVIGSIEVNSLHLLCCLTLFFLNMGHPRPLFSLFSSFQNTNVSKQMFNINKFLLMTGFEPRTSGIGSNHSSNWATQPLPSEYTHLGSTLLGNLTNVFYIFAECCLPYPLPLPFSLNTM